MIFVRSLAAPPLILAYNEGMGPSRYGQAYRAGRRDATPDR